MTTNIKNIKYIFFTELIIIVIPFSFIGTLIPIISKDLNISLYLIGLVISINAFILLITSITTGKLIQTFAYETYR